jgi:hypothetical protein
MTQKPLLWVEVGVLVCMRCAKGQGDFLFLARNFSWVHYAGAENRKGVEESHSK